MSDKIILENIENVKINFLFNIFSEPIFLKNHDIMFKLDLKGERWYVVYDCRYCALNIQLNVKYTNKKNFWCSFAFKYIWRNVEHMIIL